MSEGRRRRRRRLPRLKKEKEKKAGFLAKCWSLTLTCKYLFLQIQQISTMFDTFCPAFHLAFSALEELQSIIILHCVVTLLFYLFYIYFSAFFHIEMIECIESNDHDYHIVPSLPTKIIFYIVVDKIFKFPCDITGYICYSICIIKKMCKIYIILLKNLLNSCINLQVCYDDR